MAFQLVINSTDITDFVKSDGFNIERNDIDAADSGRDMNGTMRRRIIATKDKLAVTVRPLTDTQMSSLLSLLSNATMTVTYTQPGGTSRTATFYNSQRPVSIRQDIGGAMLYGETTFNLIEV